MYPYPTDIGTVPETSLQESPKEPKVPSRGPVGPCLRLGVVVPPRGPYTHVEQDPEGSKTPDQSQTLRIPLLSYFTLLTDCEW